MLSGGEAKAVAYENAIPSVPNTVAANATLLMHSFIMVLYFTIVTDTPALPHRRRLWIRVLVALTSTTAIFATAALVATASVLSPIGARRTAREAALREVDAQMMPGETVTARTFASQRRWTDMWRESFGVLVATNRRLLYVGAPPIPLIGPREDGPLALLVESFPYDAAFTLEPRTVWRGRGRGLLLRSPAGDVGFLVDDSNWGDALQVAAQSARSREAVAKDIERLNARVRAPAPRMAEYEYHIVRRGETLTALAARYRTSIDVLMQLNQLTGDGLETGQRLRVPKLEPDSTDGP